MTELRNVLKTLFHLQTQVNLIVETLNEIGNNYLKLREIKLEGYQNGKIDLEISSHTLLSNYSIILFCSFMDEYNKYFTPSFLNPEYKNRIIKVKKKNIEGIKRIRKWKDLHLFRNKLVAHNFRMNKKSFFSSEFSEFKFVIPNTISEKNLFSGIIYLICLNIKDEFIEIVSTINPQEVMLDKISIIGEKIENEKELEILIQKMR